MSTIATNRAVLAKRATALQRVGKSFSNMTLNPHDDETTIAINKKVKATHDDTMKVHSIFGNAMESSAEQIKKIGDGFFTVDRQSARRFK
jgi:type VII secretion effector (TIGR04197 family)